MDRQTERLTLRYGRKVEAYLANTFPPGGIQPKGQVDREFAAWQLGWRKYRRVALLNLLKRRRIL